MKETYDALPREVQAALEALHRTMGRGRYADAIPGLRELLAAHPRVVLARVLLGRALRMTGDVEGGHAQYAAAAEVAPDDPDVRLGLAWRALDDADWDDADRHALVASKGRAARGDALAVIARVREARGDAAGAAAAFLEAYEAGTKWPWLREHCRLVGKPFHDPKRIAPWPIRALERLELYDVVERALVAAAGDAVESGKKLVAGCDHTPKHTRAWAVAGGVDVVALYQALATRGGFCDCEVVMNAGREADDELGTVLVGARIAAGDLDAALASLDGWLEVRDAPPRGTLDAPAVVLDVRRVGGAAEAPPQAVGSLFAGALPIALARALPDGDATVIVSYPDADEDDDLLRVEAGRYSVTAVSDARDASMAALARDVRAAWPVAPDAPPGALALPALDVPSLLVHVPHGHGVLRVDGTTTPLDVTATAIAIAPDARRSAWLLAWRRTSLLMLEDHASGTRTKLAVRRFGEPAFSADGETVYAAADGTVYAYDVRTGAERALGVGTRVIASPDGRFLAVQLADRRFELRDAATDAVVLPAREGRALAVAPDGCTVAFVTPKHAHVLDVASGAARRVSPEQSEGDAWPSFADGGRAVVFQSVLARHRVPLDGGRTKLENDEALLRVDLASGATTTLFASERGYMKIVNPLAHPTLPLVVLRTQDAPKTNVRLVLLDGAYSSRTLAPGELSPLARLA